MHVRMKSCKGDTKEDMMENYSEVQSQYLILEKQWYLRKSYKKQLAIKIFI